MLVLQKSGEINVKSLDYKDNIITVDIKLIPGEKTGTTDIGKTFTFYLVIDKITSAVDYVNIIVISK